MVVVQKAELLLPTPEVHGSNPVFGKIYIERLLSTVSEKEAVNGSIYLLKSVPLFRLSCSL